MTCCYAGGRLAAIAAASADTQSLEDQSGSQQLGHGTTLAFGTKRLLKYIVDGQGFLAFFAPSLIFSIASFHAKLDGHRLMLESLRNFDLRAADCAIEEDRLQIEAQVCELFDGLEEPIIVPSWQSGSFVLQSDSIEITHEVKGLFKLQLRYLHLNVLPPSRTARRPAFLGFQWRRGVRYAQSQVMLMMASASGHLIHSCAGPFYMQSWKTWETKCKHHGLCVP